jgi:serine kinase of HPr protein (carbohydrate metabolism regulator)
MADGGTRMAEPANVHATGVILGDRAVLVLGESGSGKTGLAFALLAHAARSGRFARLVGDDQLFLSVAAGRLILRAPAAIAGQAEVRGLGPCALPCEARAVADLAVRLVEPAAAARYPEINFETFHDVDLPCLTLAAGDRQGALFAVAAHLGLPPFA